MRDHDIVQQTINSLMKELESVKNIKGTMYSNLAFYFIVLGIMLFFLSIVLKNLYLTFVNYELMKHDSARLPKSSNTIDNVFDIDSNHYDDSNNYYTYKFNHNEFILNKLKKQNQNVHQTFENLLKYKQKYDIDNTLYTSVTPQNISSNNDDYNYDPTRNSSFWKTLFSTPKHFQLMNMLGDYPSLN